MKTLLIIFTMFFTAQTFAAENTSTLCITARECLGEAEYQAVQAAMQRRGGAMKASIILLAATVLASKNKDKIRAAMKRIELAEANKSDVALLEDTKVDLKDSPALASSHGER